MQRAVINEILVANLAAGECPGISAISGGGEQSKIVRSRETEGAIWAISDEDRPGDRDGDLPACGWMGRVCFGTEGLEGMIFDGQPIASLSPSLAVQHTPAVTGAESSRRIGTLPGRRSHTDERQCRCDALADPRALSFAVNEAWAGTPSYAVGYWTGKRTRLLAKGSCRRSSGTDHNVLCIGPEDEGVFELPLAMSSRSQGTSMADSSAGTLERVQLNGGDLLALTSAGIIRIGNPCTGDFDRGLFYLNGTAANVAAPDSSRFVREMVR
jgi:hypothetical protein